MSAYADKQRGVHKTNGGTFKVGHPSIVPLYDTKPERMLAEAMKGLKLEFVTQLQIMGTPDFALPEAKVAVFVDGCYWHSCPQHNPGARPSTERTDHNVNVALLKKGWSIVRFWEHDIYKDARACASSVQEKLCQRKI